ncbi:hypothetical protein PLICRDRAFT_311385 [Plicaturopsis crispa FD-325 SS-3]|nr:hypothetical protein PLICRDRAFT_311385 [Plicaturopsis crispa FD-325 SS-3]
MDLTTGRNTRNGRYTKCEDGRTSWCVTSNIGIRKRSSLCARIVAAAARPDMYSCRVLTADSERAVYVVSLDPSPSFSVPRTPAYPASVQASTSCSLAVDKNLRTCSSRILYIPAVSHRQCTVQEHVPLSHGLRSFNARERRQVSLLSSSICGYATPLTARKPTNTSGAPPTMRGQESRGPPSCSALLFEQ